MRNIKIRAIALFSIISLLPFFGCTIAEEFLNGVDFYSGIPYTVSKPGWDWDIKGNLFYINGSYELAIKCFDKAIELDPSYVYPYISKGQALERLGRHDDALKEFDKAATLKPLIWVIWESKGDILFNQGKYDEALAAYNMTIELAPKDADAWFQKGNAFGLLPEFIRYHPL